MDQSVLELVALVGSDPLDILYGLDGFYQCPKDAGGRRLGPLVGYAGRDKQGRQMVGDLYANFAQAEQYPIVYEVWARMLVPQLQKIGADVYMGMPMGSILAAGSIAGAMNARVVFAEKKITALATETSREKSVLILTRHGINSGERVAICEDVTNNFSTTEEAFKLVEEAGGKVVAIVTWLNRSELTSFNNGSIPVIALVHKPMPQYQQDDPAVVADVAAGNVVWKVKPEWPRLKAVMDLHRKK